MERALAELITRLHERIDFIVVAAELADELRALVDWRPVRVPKRPIPLKIAVFFLIASIKVRRTPADLVHSTGAIVAPRVDVSTVHFCHAGFREAAGRLAPRSGQWIRKLNGLLAHGLGLVLERWCYRHSRVRCLAAVSPGIASELRRHFVTPRIVVTPNGIDLVRFCPDRDARVALRSAQGVGEGDIVILFVGGDWERKGLALAMEGVALARAAGAGQPFLWIVGDGNRLRFQALADRLGIGERTHFFGFRGDAERFYQASDVFLFPSLYEAMGMVAYEAAAAGLPLVATGCNGLEDLIGANEAGILIPRTREAISDALVVLIADPDLRARMGEMGRQRSSRYTWERSALGVLAIYGDLLSGRDPLKCSAP